MASLCAAGLGRCRAVLRLGGQSLRIASAGRGGSVALRQWHGPASACRPVARGMRLPGTVRRWSSASTGGQPERMRGVLDHLPRIVRETFFHAPVQLLVGVAVGGLGASVAGVFYFLHLQGEIDAQEIMARLDSVSIRVERPGSATQPDEGAAAVTGEGEAGQQGRKKGKTVLEELVKVPLPVLTVLGWSTVFIISSFFAWSQAKLRMQHREFWRVVNYSLNSVNGRHMSFRTLKECRLEEVFPENPPAVAMVQRALKQTSRTKAIVPLPRDYSVFVMNAFLNDISPLFAEGYVARDLGLPVTEAWYRMALTFEQDAPEMKKLRVMLVSEQLLEEIALEGTDEAHPVVERRAFAMRWEVLKEMAEQHQLGKAGKLPKTGDVRHLHRLQVVLRDN